MLRPLLHHAIIRDMEGQPPGFPNTLAANIKICKSKNADGKILRVSRPAEELIELKLMNRAVMAVPAEDGCPTAGTTIQPRIMSGPQFGGVAGPSATPLKLLAMIMMILVMIILLLI